MLRIIEQADEKHESWVSIARSWGGEKEEEERSVNGRERYSIEEGRAIEASG